MTIPNDAYIFCMTDDTGMFQHAKYSVPDPSEGYTADDNARALIMVDMLYETTKKPGDLALVYRYLRFLLYARNGAWFRNFMRYDRNFSEENGSQDCYGRCILSLGYTASRPGLPAGIRKTAEYLIEKTLPGLQKLDFPRSKAYSLLGLQSCKKNALHNTEKKLALDIAKCYRQHSRNGWHWFEDSIIYCNAVLPWAMLAWGEETHEEEYRKIGLESLDFLIKSTFTPDGFRPVGCNGWLQKGKRAAEFDQQPVEACGTLLACLEAYRLTGESRYRDCAEKCYNWYLGKNTAGVSLIDRETGGCMDGITPNGPNGNEGAESLVSWFIASLAWAAAFPAEM